MKITLTNPANTKEQPMVLEIDSQAKLRELIILIDKQRVANKLPPIYGYSYNGAPLLSVNLNKSLREILGGGDEKTLNASCEVPKDVQYNLSPKVIEEHQQNLKRAKAPQLKLSCSSFFPTKPNGYNVVQQQEELKRALPCLPPV